jgi:hypothetical protein
MLIVQESRKSVMMDDHVDAADAAPLTMHHVSDIGQQESPQKTRTVTGIRRSDVLLSFDYRTRGSTYRTADPCLPLVC